jgi:hypothetical protein
VQRIVSTTFTKLTLQAFRVGKREGDKVTKGNKDETKKRQLKIVISFSLKDIISS